MADIGSGSHIAPYTLPPVTRSLPRGLNKGEAKNGPAKAIFFNRRGMVQDQSYEDQRHRASGLNLVLAAIVLWNTIGLERAVGVLRAQGTAVPDEFLQHLSPLGWERIILTGEYRWELQQTSLPGEGTGVAVASPG